MVNYKTFLQEKLKEYGISQRKLAKNFDMTFPYFNMIINGKRKHPVGFTEKISSILALKKEDEEKLKSLSSKSKILNISYFQDKDQSFLITVYKHINKITDQQKQDFIKKII